MGSMEESLALLEKTFSKLENYIDNLKSERDFLAGEASRQEELMSDALRYRKLTIEKLEFLKKALADEIKIDIFTENQKEQLVEKSGPIHILMADDEGDGYAK